MKNMLLTATVLFTLSACTSNEKQREPNQVVDTGGKAFQAYSCDIKSTSASGEAERTQLRATSDGVGGIPVKLTTTKGSSPYKNVSVMIAPVTVVDASTGQSYESDQLTLMVRFFGDLAPDDMHFSSKSLQKYLSSSQKGAKLIEFSSTNASGAVSVKCVKK